MLQKEDVLEAMAAAKNSPTLRYLNEDSLVKMIDYWFSDLGVPKKYLEHVSGSVCFNHICSVVSSMSKSLANQVPLDIDLSFESDEFCVYIIPSSVSLTEGGKMRFEIDSEHTSPVSAEDIETFLEKKYFHSVSSSDYTPSKTVADGKQLGVKQSQLNVSVKASKESTSYLGTSRDSPTPTLAKGAYRVQVSRTPNALAEDIPVHLRFYLLEKCVFDESKKDGFDSLADERFHKQYDEKVRDAFKQVVERTTSLKNPTAEVFEGMTHEGETSTLLLVSHYTQDTSGVFVGMPNVYRRYCMYAQSKHVEIFKNNVVVFAFFLQPVDYIRDIGGTELTADESISTRIAHIKQDASLHYVLPKTSYSYLVEDGVISMQEMCYAYSAAKFAFHFLSRGQNDRRAIASGLSAEAATALAALSRLTEALNEFAFTENAIRSVVAHHISLVQALYGDFASIHMPAHLKESSTCPSVVETSKRIRDEDSLRQLIFDSCRSEESRAIFQMFLSFNSNVLRTNFYKPEKRAISYRLHPDFLNADNYPERPFGVFMMIGAEFRGFHVRFRDIARGGVRMVRSRDSLSYHSNLTKMFDECFNLASTQQRKNKDIPEGGSKGVILLGVHHQNKAEIAFGKYVDALLDLLLPEPAWCVDHYNAEELIFLGPDEGTADFMDWASEHARSRGYNYWKGFTTGKSPSRGGIPHDRFGMTTTSVRAYVNGILKKLGVDHESCTKFQTGGPDGDLGSNEILMGKEKTVAIIDGSGVVFDPEGLDSEELKKLASGRKMVENFNKEKLSSNGFFVHVSETDVTLPDGTIVKSGFQFRNEFHLNPMLHVDLFVPCGGRPNSVTDQNYKQLLFDNEGKPRVKYIVEGANLFFTQESRRLIEKNGIKLVKDASANKGGVTSSSLEVLAALALTDEEHEKTMQVKDIENPPATYKEYVEEVLSFIQHAADSEFETLWRHAEETGTPMCDTSDTLSNKIVLMRDAIQQSPSLFADESLRMKVLRRAIPKKLCTIVPFETIVSRLPESYLKALFASYLSSHFVYEKGLTASDIAFYEYANSLDQTISHHPNKQTAPFEAE